MRDSVLQAWEWGQLERREVGRRKSERSGPRPVSREKPMSSCSWATDSAIWDSSGGQGEGSVEKD